MAHVLRCTICCRPLAVESLPELPGEFYLFCATPACNPLRLENLMGEEDSEWVEKLVGS